MMLAELNQKDLTILADLMQTGKVTPVIDRTYKLSELPEAIRYLEEGHARGKVVITVEDNIELTGQSQSRREFCRARSDPILIAFELIGIPLGRAHCANCRRIRSQSSLPASAIRRREPYRWGYYFSIMSVHRRPWSRPHP